MAVPSMTYAAERLWLICTALNAMQRPGQDNAEVTEILQEAWPLLVFMQQAFLDAPTASALPQPEKYLGFYRDNLADFGFTLNGQNTQLLARLKLAEILANLNLTALQPLPADQEKYQQCWKRIDSHPAILAPELVIHTNVAGSGNDRTLGGKIDASAVQTRQMTGQEYQQQMRKINSQNTGKSRVLPRKK